MSLDQFIAMLPPQAPPKTFDAECLEDWIGEVRKQVTPQAVLELVEKFRTQRAWTDEDRAELSRAYIQRIELMK